MLQSETAPGPFRLTVEAPFLLWGCVWVSLQNRKAPKSCAFVCFLSSKIAVAPLPRLPDTLTKVCACERHLAARCVLRSSRCSLFWSCVWHPTVFSNGQKRQSIEWAFVGVVPTALSFLVTGIFHSRVPKRPRLRSPYHRRIGSPLHMQQTRYCVARVLLSSAKCCDLHPALRPELCRQP